MKKEIWEWYKGSEERYKISSLGNLASYCRNANGKLRKGVLAVGYLQVQLWVDNKMVSRKIHRMVAETFIPNPENKKEVNHKNGIKTDNRVENLEWVTPSENIIHAYRTLKRKNNLENNKGEGHYNAKYKIDDILEIRRLSNEGVRQCEIAKIYNDNPKDIGKIVRRETWKHI